MKLSYFVVALLAFGLLISTVRCEDSEPVPTPPPTKIQGESHAFVAEVSRLLELIIHSLYSNNDIFLREAISNASDALDRIRYLSLQDNTVIQDFPRMDIRIRADNSTRKLFISDTGVGMTRHQLSDYLGKIANSGTQQFIEAMKAQDVNAIGQFGVGFYSLFLVADLVTVHTKHPNDTHLVWQSDAKTGYVVAEETDEEFLAIPRGTTIVLDMKEEAAEEYLKNSKLTDLINRYSGFITFPIYLYESEEVEVTEPEVSEPIDQEEPLNPTDQDEEDLDIEEEEEKEEEPKKTETRYFWKHINDQPAIWMRPPREVSDEEYNQFYSSITSDEDAPLTHIHFKAEGEYEFRGLLFVPSKHITNLIDEFEKCRLRLYVKRVFIGDEVAELLPRWLNFLRGIIDSDDLPLHVSREQLQKTRALRAIQNRLVKKALDMLKKLAKEQPDDYKKFYTTFGRFLKVGMIEDSKSREKLSKLLRFSSSFSGKDNTTSFEEYVDRMPSHQTQIYYAVAESLEQGLALPYVEQLFLAGYEVIVFTDPLDEPAVASLGRFDEREIVPASKEDVKATTKEEDAEFERLETEFDGVRRFMKEVLGDQVEKVVISKRLVSSPATLVHPTGSASANMERLIKQQQQLDPTNKNPSYQPRRILEVNPHHPVLIGLKDKFGLIPNEDDGEDTFEADLNQDAVKQLREEVKSAIQLLHDAALLQSGYDYSDFSQLANRIINILSHDLGVASTKVNAEQIMKNIRKASDIDVEKEQDDDEMTLDLGEDEMLEFGEDGATVRKQTQEEQTSADVHDDEFGFDEL
ncbi:hypothetical protein RCL1_003879 [Eukaryota sp. TZLM3-RCL]